MTRSVDVVVKSSPAQGYDMITRARASNNSPSLAEGRNPVGVVDAANCAAGSPGASLGTGMNTDRYTPGIEAV